MKNNTKLEAGDIVANTVLGGGPMVTDNLNNITETGLYPVNLNTTNKPGTNGGFLIHIQYGQDTAAALQIFVEAIYGKPSKIYTRVNQGSSFEKWYSVGAQFSLSGNTLTITN